MLTTLLDKAIGLNSLPTVGVRMQTSVSAWCVDWWMKSLSLPAASSERSGP